MDKDRLQKVLRMLESDQEGERSNAASMLRDAADASKLDMIAFMRELVGSARSNQASPVPYPYGPQPYHPAQQVNPADYWSFRELTPTEVAMKKAMEEAVLRRMKERGWR